MKKFLTLFITFLLISTLAACEKKDKLSTSNKEKLKEISFPKEKDQILELDIYFDSSSKEKQPEIAKEERIVQKEVLVGELILNELIKGPSRNSQLKPVLPLKTKVLGFSIKDSIAYVELSNDAAVPMTAEKEKACLKSIVYSLTQLPSITKVKITINPGDIKTLGGHIDLSKPLGKDDF